MRYLHKAVPHAFATLLVLLSLLLVTPGHAVTGGLRGGAAGSSYTPTSANCITDGIGGISCDPAAVHGIASVTIVPVDGTIGNGLLVTFSKPFPVPHYAVVGAFQGFGSAGSDYLSGNVFVSPVAGQQLTTSVVVFLETVYAQFWDPAAYALNISIIIS